MTRIPCLTSLAIVGALQLAPSLGHSQTLVGTWQLASRTDSSAAGVQPADGPLGSDPIAWLIYDGKGHVAAQLMARDRSKATPRPATAPDPNNSAASGGYDAYFGTYEIDAARQTVTHHLLGALSPSDVGRSLKRSYWLKGDTLTISFDARRMDGVSVTRRLVWRRVSP